MNLKIALLGGDGVGPEVLAQAVKCLQSVETTFNHHFTFSYALVGAAAIDQTGNPLPDKTLELCKNSDAVLFGAVGTPKYDNDPNAKIRPEDGLLKLRKELTLFSNIRPVKVYTSLIDRSPLKKEIISGVDLIIYRELTGGIYFGEKKMNDAGTVASDLCEYSEKEIGRIAHLAFKAAKNRKEKVTLIDKANILESSRLWRKVVTKISESYPEVTLDFLFIDNAAMQMMLNPSQFDVILTSNMFGDIISEEASVISGSIGLLASASIGSEKAMFEPIHRSYAEAEGKDIANPIAAILSAAMLLEHFGLNEEAHSVHLAVENALNNNVVTPDLNPKSKFGTNYVGDYIANSIVDTDDFLNLNDENIGLGRSTII